MVKNAILGLSAVKTAIFGFSTVKSKKAFFTADKLKIAFFTAEKPTRLKTSFSPNAALDNGMIPLSGDP